MPEYVTVLAVSAVVIGILWLVFDGLPRYLTYSRVFPDEHLKQVAPEPHAAPVRPYSVDNAHWVMQDHIDCDTDSCHAKRAAFRTLVEAGHVTPARNLR
ncbi:hypothetical protein AB4305_32340 [Nocardia sp. 2YAB30]|uniref:hypothetical protein n=1 Tax=Nocardia sp. 2YAB30 TaxID=3233022 RepID=UPI003F9C3B46